MNINDLRKMSTEALKIFIQRNKTKQRTLTKNSLEARQIKELIEEEFWFKRELDRREDEVNGVKR